MMPSADDSLLFARDTLRRLHAAGHEAYFVGGCVRDHLMGLVPKDYDIATGARPDEVKRMFPSARLVGAAFGVVLVTSGRRQVEVATFRCDGRYSDGRRPDSVTFSSAREDAQRRDFTVNGLFWNPESDEIVDFVGGQADLRSRLLRTIGDPELRFEEDHLRLLRGVRFAARFSLGIEPGTWASTLRRAGKVAGIAPERIAEELRLMLTAGSRARAWELLVEAGLAKVIFRTPGEASLRPEAGPLLSGLPAEASFSQALAAVALLERPLPVDQPLSVAEISAWAHGLRTYLRVSREVQSTVDYLLSGVAEVAAEAAMPQSRLSRLMMDPAAAELVELVRALATVSARPGVSRFLAANPGPIPRVPPLLDGTALAAMGYVPGPEFRRVLDAVYDLQLDGSVSDQAAATQAARKLMESRPGEPQSDQR